MFFKFEKDFAIIYLMLETLEKIFAFTSDMKNDKDFENDKGSFDATLMNFIVLGESINKLSDDFMSKYNHIDWRKIYAFRDVLAHDYSGILPEEVWEIIQKHLPMLQGDLQYLVK